MSPFAGEAMRSRAVGDWLLPLMIVLATMALPGLTRGQEIALQHCDTLPVVEATAAEQHLRFLLDTAATSLLNLRSFKPGEEGPDVRITSWTGTRETRAREVTLSDVIIGSTRLKKLRLPAVDLSAIGATCHGRIDGILGADLLARLGATIDLHHHTLRFASLEQEQDGKLIPEMRDDLRRCLEAFKRFDEPSLGDCLAPDIVLYTADADIHGRQPVLDYFRQRYIHPGSVAQLKLHLNTLHAIGRTVWCEYEFTLDTIRATLQGHGIALCLKSDGHWQIVSMHDSALGSDRTASTAR
jgi:hypothetical protein